MQDTINQEQDTRRKTKRLGRFTGTVETEIEERNKDDKCGLTLDPEKEAEIFTQRTNDTIDRLPPHALISEEQNGEEYHVNRHEDIRTKSAVLRDPHHPRYSHQDRKSKVEERERRLHKTSVLWPENEMRERKET